MKLVDLLRLVIELLRDSCGILHNVSRVNTHIALILEVIWIIPRIAGWLVRLFLLKCLMIGEVGYYLLFSRHNSQLIESDAHSWQWNVQLFCNCVDYPPAPHLPSITVTEVVFVDAFLGHMSSEQTTHVVGQSRLVQVLHQHGCLNRIRLGLEQRISIHDVQVGIFSGDLLSVSVVDFR